ncbi:putative F-box/LRR-repeat protein At3g49150 [Phragmites australis]|uniref:putative F-box/LRR-repeat protein At3g49150 n=1 Tax=Phragmites australis TaxID=29695 RepID=UPI002D766297|nr:putative F-box/LRR-repeat protein At3g49150 [Phragmites australis]
MSMKRQRDQERRRRQAQACNGLIVSRAKKGGSPCQRDDDSQDGETELYLGPRLPEDILCHIHSLMPMEDAARVSCVSRAFLRSWRCHPNLAFSKEMLGLNKKACGNDELARDFSSKVDNILKKHSGIGVKTLKIHMFNDFNAKDSCNLDSWLQIAVTPGIEELTVKLPLEAKYNFPYSLLSNGSGDSIRYLHLACCSFRPTAELGWFRSLTRLHLNIVRTTGDDLGCLLSSSFALERLEIRYCNGIVCLKVPCVLQRLSYLQVLDCEGLKMIDSEAPNISSFWFHGNNVQLSLGETLKMKNLHISFSGAVHYTRTELPFSMPNLETLRIISKSEMADTPMLQSKFLHLKNLSIILTAVSFSPGYDYISLVSFLDACPSLENFDLDVTHRAMEHVSIFTDPSDLRRMREQHHHKMKSMKIRGFSSAKSLVELTCHVVESVTSLECLTLETCQSSLRCWLPGNKSGKCTPLPMGVLIEAQRALSAIRIYIEPKVPSTVKLHVVETCSRCHVVEQL